MPSPAGAEPVAGIVQRATMCSTNQSQKQDIKAERLDFLSGLNAMSTFTGIVDVFSPTCVFTNLLQDRWTVKILGFQNSHAQHLSSKTNKTKHQSI